MSLVACPLSEVDDDPDCENYDGLITGPHTAYDGYGAPYSFFRCECCGVESADKEALSVPSLHKDTCEVSR